MLRALWLFGSYKAQWFMMQGVKCGVSSVYKHMQISVEILELALVLGDLGADRCISFYIPRVLFWCQVIGGLLFGARLLARLYYCSSLLCFVNVCTRHRRKPFLHWFLIWCILCDSGFEGCSMVPSIYPLETLHNSLSLKQVDEFLNKVCESRRETLTKTLKSR